MKRLSIFHRLEYWNNLLINRLLDPMHIFKNVGESIWKHMIGEKDTTTARHDLKESNTKKEYWIKDGEDHAPKSPWTFTKEELHHVRSIIKQRLTLLLLDLENNVTSSQNCISRKCKYKRS